MRTTLNESQVTGIMRAYEDGVTLQAISQLFRIEQDDLIILIHAYKCGRKKGACHGS